MLVQYESLHCWAVAVEINALYLVQQLFVYAVGNLRNSSTCLSARELDFQE